MKRICHFNFTMLSSRRCDESAEYQYLPTIVYIHNLILCFKIGKFNTAELKSMLFIKWDTVGFKANSVTINRCK